MHIIIYYVVDRYDRFKIPDEVKETTIESQKTHMY